MIEKYDPRKAIRPEFFRAGTKFHLKELSKESEFVRSLYHGPIFLGIDGGVTTGVALWSRKENKLVDVCSFSFWDAIRYFDKIVKMADGMGVTAVVEDPRLIRPVFGKKSDFSRKQTYGKISQDVGAMKAYTALMVEWLHEKNIPTILVKPSQYTKTKLDAKTFKNMTKWDKKTNEHSRDAAMLVWGK